MRWSRSSSAGTRRSAISSLMSWPSPPAMSCTASGASADHGAERDHATKVRFVIVSLISYALNSFWVWLLFTLPRLGPRGADRADAVRHAGRHLHAQPAVGFPLMERVVYEQMAELRPAPLVVSRPPQSPRRADPPARRSAQGRARSSRSAAAPATTSPMLGEFGHVDALELDDEARADRREAARPSGHERAAARARRRPEQPLRPGRRFRRDRAYRRRSRRARVDRERGSSPAASS